MVEIGWHHFYIVFLFRMTGSTSVHAYLSSVTFINIFKHTITRNWNISYCYCLYSSAPPDISVRESLDSAGLDSATWGRGRIYSTAAQSFSGHAEACFRTHRQPRACPSHCSLLAYPKNVIGTKSVKKERGRACVISSAELASSATRRLARSPT